ncbi:MAG: cupin [Ferruginibacter sp.]|nr:cupin [Ferruginibacter sp.]
MKRNKFLAVITTIAAAPFVGFSQLAKNISDRAKGFRIPAGEGRYHGHLQLKGVNANIQDVKISGKDTEGGLAIFEQTSLSQGRGTPLHYHVGQDEVFYVIDGSYRFKVGDEEFDLNTGDSIFLPRQVPHAWTQRSAKGKMLVTVQPAGKLEDFFVIMAGLDHEPTPAEMKGIFDKCEMVVVGPPLKL